ncbi:hypothetical protein BGW38_005188 [Lunasporangiospora selenospora]|uniref:Uncharacterized protein n=1 Tax=Lunasporangiospora selenospora TaxID=979761 RepID=A0A9P6G1R9_9FUNG|nr:hypothetical protein BGW38_005188 [Lunasporangiospora selenospora]
MNPSKINVSSKQDVNYIVERYGKVLNAKLDEEALKNGDSETMLAVHQLLERWFSETFHTVAQNLTINGISYEEAMKGEEFEPYDESLARTLQSRQLKVEELTLRVTERRKRVPEQVKMLLDDVIRRESAFADRLEFTGDGDPNPRLDSLRAQEKEINKDLAAEEFSSSMSSLSELRKTVASNIARLEGAQAVVDEAIP